MGNMFAASLPTFLSFNPFVRVSSSMYPSINSSVCLSTWDPSTVSSHQLKSIYLSIYLSIYIFYTVYMFVCVCICLSALLVHSLYLQKNAEFQPLAQAIWVSNWLCRRSRMNFVVELGESSNLTFQKGCNKKHVN